jgi:enoyl-CoA hydratase
MAMDLDAYRRDFPGLEFNDTGSGILEVVLSNPARRNALDETAHRSLARVWKAIDVDDAVRVVLLRGAGDHFSSGGEFGMVEDMINDEATLVRVWKDASDLVYNLVNCSKPVVSAIRGAAVGAGLAAALLADISIAARNAKLLDGHTTLGVATGDHAVMVWPLLCGLAKARFHLLLNEPLSGDEAERIGLVARALPDEEVYPAALDAARRLASGSATALSWTKHALNNWLRLAGPSFDASLALEFLGFRLRDARKGLEAIKNRRPPDFSS